MKIHMPRLLADKLGSNYVIEYGWWEESYLLSKKQIKYFFGYPYTSFIYQGRLELLYKGSWEFSSTDKQFCELVDSFNIEQLGVTLTNG